MKKVMLSQWIKCVMACIFQEVEENYAMLLRQRLAGSAPSDEHPGLSSLATPFLAVFSKQLCEVKISLGLDAKT